MILEAIKGLDIVHFVQAIWKRTIEFVFANIPHEHNITKNGRSKEWTLQRMVLQKSEWRLFTEHHSHRFLKDSLEIHYDATEPDYNQNGLTKYNKYFRSECSWGLLGYIC